MSKLFAILLMSFFVSHSYANVGSCALARYYGAQEEAIKAKIDKAIRKYQVAAHEYGENDQRTIEAKEKASAVRKKNEKRLEDVQEKTMKHMGNCLDF